MQKISKLTILYYMLNYGKNIICAFAVLKFSTSHTFFYFLSLFVIFSSIFSFIYNSLEILFVFHWEKIQDTLVVESGVFSQKTVRINESKIISVQTKQAFYLIPFHLFESKIILDSVKKKTIRFRFITESQMKCLEQLKKREVVQSLKNKKNYFPDYQVKTSRIFKSSLLTLNYFYVFTILFLVQDMFDKVHLKVSVISFIKELWNGQKFLFFIVFFILIIFSAIIKQYKDYSKFQVFVDKKSIVIRNGIGVSDRVSILQKDIVGIKLKQDLGKKFNKLWSLELIVKNQKLSKESNLVKDVLPYATKTEIMEFLAKIQIPFEYQQENIFRNKLLFLKKAKVQYQTLLIQKGWFYCENLQILSNCIEWRTKTQFSYVNFEFLGFLSDKMHHIWYIDYNNLSKDEKIKKV